MAVESHLEGWEREWGGTTTTTAATTTTTTTTTTTITITITITTTTTTTTTTTITQKQKPNSTRKEKPNTECGSVTTNVRSWKRSFELGTEILIPKNKKLTSWCLRRG